MGSVRRLITPKTKAIIAVDMCGQPCDYDALRNIADEHNLVVIADASHSLGGKYNGRHVGTVADLTTLSFHPVKNITTGEGGMICTNNKELGDRARIFRQHGITRDHKERTNLGVHYYEMQELGYNYRITDIQCALGSSQLAKLDGFIQRRQEVAAEYHAAFEGETTFTPVVDLEGRENAHHLFVIRLQLEQLNATRDQVYDALRAEGLGVNVHYLPVHMHPYYRKLGYAEGLCPVAEALYDEIISLPCFPSMTSEDVNCVITAVKKVCHAYAK